MSIENGTRFHSLVWLAWLVAGIAAVGTNPLLNVLVMAQAILVAVTCHTDSPVGRSFGVFVRLGLLLLVVRALLSAVPIGGVTYGGTVLLVLPELQLPIWLGGLQLGGAATAEMLAGGVVAGVRLWAIILVFGAFNAVADHYRLLRRLPRALFHAGLATTIALTFVPHVVTQAQAIRDAQRVRGHRFRTMRDALPLVVPLLSGGLERSIQLAEAMDSRGYGRTTAPRRGFAALQLLAIAGLTLLAVGLYAALTGAAWGWALVLAGSATVIVTLNRLGAGVRRSSYRAERWHRRDTVVVLAAGCVICGMLLLRQLDAGGLVYSTLPRVVLPPFDPLAGALLLLLSTPALLQMSKENRDVRRSRFVDTTLGDRA